MGMSELLGKAFSIGSETKFRVRIYEPDSEIYTEQDLTYIQLGTILINKSKDIRKIYIFQNKPE